MQEAVAAAIKSSGVARKELFITTKVPCCPQGEVSHCANHTTTVAQDVMADLEQLGLPYVDLMLLHWTCDTFAQTVDAYKALQPIVAAGKARAIGISNFNATMIDALLAAPGVTVKPAINQCGFSIGGHSTPALGRDLATLKKCEATGITYSAYSPLGGLSHIDVMKDADVVRIAAAHKVSAAQVALRWVVQQGVVAVTASEKKEYDVEDLDVFGFELSEAEMALLSSK